MSENLYQRKSGGNWYGRVEIGGVEHRRSLRTCNKVEAKKRRDKWVEKLTALTASGEPRHTYKDAVTRWQQEYLPSIKPGTATRYAVSSLQLDPTFRDLYVDEITIRKVGEYVSLRKMHKATNATIRRDLTALSSILRCCVGWGWLETNAARSYDRGLIPERRDPYVLPTHEEIDAMIAHCPGNFARCVMLLRHTGMRENEAVTLEHPQVNLKAKQITLSNTKRSRARTIPLSDAAVGTLSGTPRHLKSRWVFWHGAEGEPYRNFASRFSEIAKRAKFNHTCHSLRHRYAVDYLKAGGSIYDLQKILGHASLKTTEIYLDHLTPEEEQTAKQPAQNPAQV